MEMKERMIMGMKEKVENQKKEEKRKDNLLFDCFEAKPWSFPGLFLVCY